ncbi:MAG: quinone-dependent dihydroorotate dehydrogenase [bacterium]|nr:quinone-dependent dihydroorotate dehydrogenase [bacterium]
MLKNIKLKIIGFFYKRILRPCLFLIDPENIHNQVIILGNLLGKSQISRGLIGLFFNYTSPRLNQKILNINFPNPVGLAAGFDKNAKLISILPSVGFGFMEIGSITGNPCSGNPKPRLWRLVKSEGLVIHYGLNNKGCESISKNLKGVAFKIPIGINIAMTNSPENNSTEMAIGDYLKSATAFKNIGDFLTINISCPNTLGGQPFLEPQKLNELLTELDKIKLNKPVFVKLSPDLEKIEIDKILEIIKNHHINGIICSNLSKKRKNVKIIDSEIPEKGGISGKPLKNLSDNLLAYIYKKEKNRFILIGCGGIFSAEDAYRKIRLGASLVELITGMIYEGPQLISDINHELIKLLDRDGFKNIQEAIGVDNH